MRADRTGPDGAAPARPLGRDRVAALLARNETVAALHTLDLDEMTAGSDHITDEESELLQSESLAARGLDQTLADRLRRRRLEGETSSASYVQEVSNRVGCRPGRSDA